MIRALLLALTSLVVLSGCSGTSIADIRVEGGKTPQIKKLADFSVETTQSRVITKGDGPKVKKTDALMVQYLGTNGRTGEAFDSTYTRGKPTLLALGEGTLPGFSKGLVGQRVGSRVLVAVAPKDGFTQGLDQYGITATDTLVFVFDIVKALPATATGATSVAPPVVPTLVMEDGHPAKFTKTAVTPATPAEGIYPLITGTGPAIKKGQTVVFRYFGQLYPDGEVFNAWGDPIALDGLGEGGSIKCFEQLIGQKVGSRVILVCPTEVAYPKPQSGQPAGPLIFVVDLLDAV